MHDVKHVQHTSYLILMILLGSLHVTAFCGNLQAAQRCISLAASIYTDLSCSDFFWLLWQGQHARLCGHPKVLRFQKTPHSANEQVMQASCSFERAGSHPLLKRHRASSTAEVACMAEIGCGAAAFWLLVSQPVACWWPVGRHS